MKKILLLNTLILPLFLSACDKPQETEQQPPAPRNEQTIQTASDIKLKQEEPAAPSISYEPIYVSDEGVGYDNIFTLEDRGSEDSTSKAIMYQSKAGSINVMEQVVDDVDNLFGYLIIERAYKFGNKYILVISTGENGNSCPATTYAFTYDTKEESVTGKTEIDGCSEIIESFAEGNKLTIKKDGKATIVYNGEVK